MNLMNEAKAIQPYLMEHRHYLHAHPELGFDLSLTTAHLCQELSAHDISHEVLPCGGIFARIGPTGSKSILLRADMDALPMQEQSGVLFTSLHDGKMHSCGHDIHMAMLLGAVILLKKHETELSGQVICCFQPAEETLAGARSILGSGLLSPMPDHAFALHVFPSDHLKTGEITCTAGEFMTSVDLFEVCLHGKSAHGSAPQCGVNPIYAAMHIIGAITDVMRYELDPQIPAVLTICQISSGTAKNIIPETCTFGGTLRMLNEENRAFVKERLSQILQAAEMAYRVRAEISLDGMSLLENDPDFTIAAHDWITEMDGARINDVGTHINMASEDFAEFCMQIPSAMFEIASRSPERRHFSGHNPCVLFDDDVLWRGSAVYAQVAYRYLNR